MILPRCQDLWHEKNLKLLNELSEDDSCEEMTFNNDDNFNINDKVNFNENDHKIY